MFKDFNTDFRLLFFDIFNIKPDISLTLRVSELCRLDFSILEISRLITCLILLFQGLTVDLSIQISIWSGLVSHEEQIFLINRSRIEDAMKEIEERILFADSALCSGCAHITSERKRPLPNGQFLDRRRTLGTSQKRSSKQLENELKRSTCTI